MTDRQARRPQLRGLSCHFHHAACARADRRSLCLDAAEFAFSGTKVSEIPADQRALRTPPDIQSARATWATNIELARPRDDARMEQNFHFRISVKKFGRVSWIGQLAARNAQNDWSRSLPAPGAPT